MLVGERCFLQNEANLDYCLPVNFCAFLRFASVWAALAMVRESLLLTINRLMSVRQQVSGEGFR